MSVSAEQPEKIVRKCEKKDKKFLPFYLKVFIICNMNCCQSFSEGEAERD